MIQIEAVLRAGDTYIIEQSDDYEEGRLLPMMMCRSLDCADVKADQEYKFCPGSKAEPGIICSTG